MIEPFESSGFERLIWPVPVARFFEKHWERRPLVIQRGEPRYFSNLLSMREMDRIISSGFLVYPQCVLVKEGVDIPSSRYGADGTGGIDVDALYSEYDRGATIVVNSLNRHLKSLATLCQSLECQFNHSVQTNIYLTPPRSRGFAPHYDTHDVFILQIAGSKQWRLCERALPLPDESQPFDSALYRPTKLIRSCKLKPGDTLYIPRGFIHEAAAATKASLHITLGLTAYLWSDVFCEALNSVCHEDSRFRKSLRPGFALRAQPTPAEQRQFRGMLRLFSKRANLARTFDRITDHFISRSAGYLDGQLVELEELRDLKTSSILRVRPMVFSRFRREGAKVCVLFHGKKICFPRAIEPLLRSIRRRRGTFRIDDLPGELDRRSKLVLARTLIREGFLMREPGGIPDP